jgi:hypothetical protein
MSYNDKLDVVVTELLCFGCKHYLGSDICNAFMDGIPDDILNMKIEHGQPYPGDHGIQFEAAE